MIWLVSYPRSGNTFLRNVLFEVYGIASSTFHTETDYPVDADYATYPVVKTHLLPDQLIPNDPNIPVVYLVRDGRDALVSLAHHKKDIYAPDSDFHQNLRAAILAKEGSFFGGWSEHVNQWQKRAVIVIRFEELIADPIACVERLRPLLDLPEPNRAKLPNFEQLKSGRPEYGSGKHFWSNSEEAQAMASRWFRKGKVDGWKTEMDQEEQRLFWEHHGATMEQLGYEQADGKKAKSEQPQFKVLIEASKVLMHYNDGIKRYQLELLKQLLEEVELPDSPWQIDLHINGEITALQDFRERLLLEDEKGLEGFARSDAEVAEMLQQSVIKRTVKKWMPNSWYQELAVRYRESSIRYKAEVQLARWRSVVQLAQEQKRYGAYDLIHLPLPQHFEPFAKIDANFLVTVHDLTHRYFAEYHEKRNVLLAEKGMQFLLEKEAAVIAVSDSTRNDLLKEYAVGENRVFTVYEGVNNKRFYHNQNQHLEAEVLRKYGIPDTPFLLCLSTIEPRKNLRNTVLAFQQMIKEHPELDCHLVIAGKKGWKTESIFGNVALSEKVLFTGFVEDHHLPALYTRASALCYLSFYEGFGLPPLEAMQCQTPVVYGNNSSMQEIIGDCGYPADPHNVDEIAQLMSKVLLDEEYRKTIAKKGLARVQEFTWKRAAKETLTAYRESILKK